MGQEKNTKPPSQIDFELVDTTEKLSQFARNIEGAEMIAVDLEADSMFHYQEKVCLVQMAANGFTAVIDPLKIKDLDILAPLFADQRICKVLHGADYDVRSLYRDFGIIINNLFDTQLACMYLGHAETGLEAVVAHRFGVELNKKFQKKDWSQRPLPDEMVAYAASDVLYLIPLAKTLMAELDEKGRLAWVLEGCCHLSQVRPQENHKPLFLKCRGAGRLTPRQLAVLETLLRFRDNIAQHKDRPLFKIISNAALLKIATTQPETVKQLKAGKTLSGKQLDMYAPAIVAAVKEAMAVPDDQLPKYPRKRAPRLSPRIPRRVNALRAWRDKLAEDLELDPALLFNKSLIREIAVNKPDSLETLQSIENMHQWQTDAFGEQILSVLKKVP